MDKRDTTLLFHGDLFDNENIEELTIYSPYKSDNTFSNILRNKWFKMKLPFPSIWYNKDFLKMCKNNIIVYDTAISTHYVKWLRRNNQRKRIIFIYINNVKNSIDPDEIRNYVELYTWDKEDAKKYNMKLYNGTYNAQPIKNEKTIYDVTFIGTDKGRLNYLLEIRSRLENMGLKTNFYIVGDHVYSNKKNGYRYKKAMKYDEVLKVTMQSKAIMEIMQEGQVGPTFRTMESIFYGIKLITNNKSIVNYDFYDKRNIFILGVDDPNKICDFIKKRYVQVDSKILYKYSLEGLINSL